MGLQATIDGAVTAAFAALGDLVTKATLQAASTFDEVLETETPGLTGTIDTVQEKETAASKFFASLAGGQSEADDITLLADANSATITPVQNMAITWKGNEYNLHSIDDTQGALLMLGLRRPI